MQSSWTKGHPGGTLVSSAIDRTLIRGERLKNASNGMYLLRPLAGARVSEAQYWSARALALDAQA
jgi:hypothetical protein